MKNTSSWKRQEPVHELYFNQNIKKIKQAIIPMDGRFFYDKGNFYIICSVCANFFPLLVYIFFIDDFKNTSFYDLLYDGA